MVSLTWLNDVAPGPRWALIGATAWALALGTVYEAGTAAAMALMVGLVAVWTGVWAFVARPAAAARQERLARQEAHQARDRGILAERVMAGAREGTHSGSLSSLAAMDPAFSLPLFLARVGRMVAAQVGSHEVLVGPAVVERVEVLGSRVQVTLAVPIAAPQGSGARRVVVSRPTSARTPPPASSEVSWSLGEVAPLDAMPEVAIPVSGSLAAARRALLARAEAFDLEGFEVLIAQLQELLGASGATPAGLTPYCTPEGLDAVRWWRAGAGLPGTAQGEGAEQLWLEVEEDGWYERIEVQCGARVLGLLRPSGDPSAPWQLWRVRRQP